MPGRMSCQPQPSWRRFLFADCSLTVHLTPPARVPLLSHPPAHYAAEDWFAQHGLPCPPGTAIAEHMLRVASDAPMTRHLLLSLAQEAKLNVGNGNCAALGSAFSGRASASTASPVTLPLSDSAGGSVDGTDGGEGQGALALGRSPFEVSPLAASLTALTPSQLGGGHRRTFTAGTVDTEASEQAAQAAGPSAAGAPHQRG